MGWGRHLLWICLGCQVTRPLRVLKDEDGEGHVMVEAGQPLSLQCSYRLEGDTLYSLKWYRDDKEFFRYIPRESPQVTIFLLPGVVLADNSSPTRLGLKNTSLATNGIFKCEISAGPPRFQTDIIQTRIQVVELPKSGPTITGVDSKYQVGDLITANCISPLSVPPVKLTWYINSDSATPSQAGPQEDSVRMTDSPNSQPVSVAPLSFVVREAQLESGQGLRLKCTASVLDLYWRSSEVATVVRARVAGSWSLAFSSSPSLPSSTFQVVINLLLTYIPYQAGHQ